MSTQTAEWAPSVAKAKKLAPSTASVLLFAATSFLSAFLLFQVQLIVNKHILPWFGGSAAVWTTSMLVFQLLLLGGYVYSHLITTRLSISRQFQLHSILLAVATLLIIALSFTWSSAITPSAGWKPAQGAHPIAHVCLIILVSAGLPFFVLSTSAPLLQYWFSRLGYGAKAYRLYALSNFGSLLGLLSFPFLLEPVLGLRMQGQLWALSFCLFAIACLLCGRQTWKFGVTAAAEELESTIAEPIPGWRRRANRVLWFLLAACASSLLLATTNLLCHEVITVPLLWVLPLSIYLFSFISCFDHPRWYQRAVFHPLFVVALFFTCAALQSERNFVMLLLAPLALLFATCMICHGELVRLKPGVKHLTSFYLTISAGGAAGGIFVALIAPRLFTSFVEFQLSIAGAVVLLLIALFLDRQSWIYSEGFLLPLAVVGGTILVAFGMGFWLPVVAGVLDTIRFYPAALLVGTLVVLGSFFFERATPREGTYFRFIQILAVLLAIAACGTLYYSTRPTRQIESSTRNFYGVVQVVRNGVVKELLVGETVHGAQFDPPNQHFPLTYYGPDSGIGIVLRNHPKRSGWSSNLRVGVVGLGTGTLAAYGRQGDSIRFYELDPDVIKLISGDQPAFTYLRDSPASVNIVLGDARLSLEREEAEGKVAQFDILVLDAFSGDAIPVHLLTQEAFETYWKQLDSEKGILALHVTSRHVDLLPVLLGAAQHFNAHSLMTFNYRRGMVFDSGWFLMSKDPDALNIPGLAPITVQYVRKVSPRLWTDDRSDVFRLIH